MSNPITWETNAGSIGTYPAQVSMSFNVQASASTGYTITKYVLISGSLANGLEFRDDGKIFGIPDTVTSDTTSTFVVRVFATDGLISTVSDRTFTITVTGAATPSFSIPSGSILQTLDSEWVEIPITYNNPISTNPVVIRILQGELPPGLEINEFGLIRGYPQPPVNLVTLPSVSTVAVSTDETNNYITVLSTANFSINRPIIFNGTSFGGINAGTTYFIKEIIGSTQITVSTIIGADALTLTTANGYMDVTLPATSRGDPEKKIYTFTVDLLSPKGNDRAVYSITVINQQLPVADGGPGLPDYTRLPVLFNTRPPTYNIEEDSTNFGYYVLPPVGSVSPEGSTYTLSQQAYIGEFQSDNFFSFHLLGYDFDNKTITYLVSGLPVWATADSETGWIYGNPTGYIAANDIEEFSFTVRVLKTIGGEAYNSPDYKFTFKIANGIVDEIIWTTNSDLGFLYNASISYKNVEAQADVTLLYELTPNSNSLPPNLELKSDGKITGIVAYQPTNNFELDNANSVFDFTIRAYNVDVLKTVAAENIKENVKYFINTLGTTVWADIGANLISAGNFAVGYNYLITNVGGNASQLTFIGANLVSAGSFEIGQEYIIHSLGTTSWDSIGVIGSAAVNTIFTATGPGSGTGDAFETKFLSTGVGQGSSQAYDEIFIATGAANGSGSANTYLITSDKTFELTINQHNNIPTDNLYIKCTPNANDRNIINNLLTDGNIIPSNYLYRPNDANFGKAKDVSFVHAYGIYSSNIDEYIEAVKKNHYWKEVTLGQLGTAIAKDENNTLIYEVVYSNIIDNLLVYDPKFGIDYRYSTSIPIVINWPRFINLNLGPWYTSSTDIYTSYIFDQPAEIITNFTEFQLLTQDGLILLTNGGIPTFYTSLSPGKAKILYPNSIDNMRERVEQDLGVDYNFDLLPLWMTGQQLDGNTLGYTPAWVIAYVKPAEKINTLATQTFARNGIIEPKIVVDSTTGFVVGRPIVFTGNTFGNIVNGQVYYVKEILSSTEITITTSITYDANNFPIPGPAYPLYDENDDNFGAMTVTFDPISYADIIRQNIIENWTYTLNQVDFEIDRFIVDKQLTYDYLTDLNPSVWYEYPSATPTPDPLDSKNFYVIFPRKTILPEKTQEI
jgi:hypothetical protein